MASSSSNTSKATTIAKATNISNSGIAALLKYFLIWKTLLLVIACASPGPGYDTSTQILFESGQEPASSALGRVFEYLALRLTRWDGIYFASNSAYGHFNEQNWAFSWALARCTSYVARACFSWLSVPLVVQTALAGILISILSHFAAVVALYHLTYNVVSGADTAKRRVAFTAACLHIISPAGLFLSAPYGESTFAMFNFAGALCYALVIQIRLRKDGNPAMDVIWTLLSGLCIGLATIVRSNGLLGGLLFAWDALMAMRHPISLTKDYRAFTTFAATICAGVFVGIGFTAPQLVAFVEYCMAGNTRPWCTRTIPSIYSWVQSHYWEVGFLRYWTLNNLPLFLLATPMLGLMLYTAVGACIGQASPTMAQGKDQAAQKLALAEGQIYWHVIPRLGLQQLILALMAATSFHVQIVNRISSGYPVLYIALAHAMCGSSVKSESTTEAKKSRHPARGVGTLSEPDRYLQWIVRSMAMYAIVQGGLYSSFLPPA